MVFNYYRFLIAFNILSVGRVFFGGGQRRPKPRESSAHLVNLIMRHAVFDARFHAVNPLISRAALHVDKLF